MYGCDRSDRLDFDDDPVRDNDIRAVAAVQFIATIDDGYRLLSREGESNRSKLETQTFLVDGFQKTGAEFAVNPDGRTDNSAS
jgi:hypothetical protein